jgi:hypothetical protein
MPSCVLTRGLTFVLACCGGVHEVAVEGSVNSAPSIDQELVAAVEVVDLALRFRNVLYDAIQGFNVLHHTESAKESQQPVFLAHNPAFGVPNTMCALHNPTGPARHAIWMQDRWSNLEVWGS